MNETVTDNINIPNLYKFEQQIFECTENIEDLQSKIVLTNAETILIKHLSKAINILDLHFSNHLNRKKKE